jgi:putative transposase
MVYATHLYFLGLSLRNTSKALSCLRIVNRSHTAIRDCIQKHKPKRLFYKRSNVSEFIVDETQIKVGSEYVWLWVAIEPENRRILALDVSKERNMLLLRDLLQVWSEHMENIWFQQMVEHGIHKPVDFFISNNVFIPLWRKAL